MNRNSTYCENPQIREKGKKERKLSIIDVTKTPTTVTIATYSFFLQTIYHICCIIGSLFKINNSILWIFSYVLNALLYNFDNFILLHMIIFNLFNQSPVSDICISKFLLF